jgi:hypothetical protein
MTNFNPADEINAVQWLYTYSDVEQYISACSTEGRTSAGAGSNLINETHRETQYQKERRT